MKCTLVIILLLTGMIPAFAQVASGNKFISGTVNLSILGGGGNTQTAITFSPTFGYFIDDHLAVGGSLGVISQLTERSDADLTLYLSPFVRWYFPIVDDKFYFFADGSIAFSYGNSAVGLGDFRSSEDAFSISLAVSPGFAYFPAERWGLDFTLTGLGLSVFDVGGEGGALTSFTLGATTLSPSLGFSYYF